MKLIHLSTTRPVTVTAAVLLLAIFGVLALLRTPIQLKPTIDQPVITVKTTFLGAAPQEVEQQITDPIEEKLQSVENLKKITSTSQEGRSSISLEFDWGVNKDLASIDILKKLNLVEDLPEDAEEPIISAVSSDEVQPIFWAIIKGKAPDTLKRKFADDLIEPRFRRVAGVGDVRVFGGRQREVQVILDHRALTARGLTIEQVRRALNAENRNVRGGPIDEGKRRYNVRTVGQFSSVNEINSVIIAKDGGAPVYLRDVAEVIDTFKERQSIVKERGEATVAFGIVKKTGTNTLSVIRGVHAKIAELNRELEPKGLHLLSVYDESEYIDDSIELVTQNLRFGALLAVIVLIFFLHSLRSTLIIGFSIPVSVVGTFIFILLLGRSLNIISLAGLAFAVGMVVDNAIVVLENIFRHMQLGKGRLAAAVDGAREVWGAVLASTLTTLAVFVPIVFVKEEVGQLFTDLAIAIGCAVGLSLIISITVIPMLCGRYLRVSAPSQPTAPRRFAGARFVLDAVMLGWLGRWFAAFMVESARWFTVPRGLSRHSFSAFILTFGVAIIVGAFLAESFGGGLGILEWLALGAVSYLLLDTAVRTANLSGMNSNQADQPADKSTNAERPRRLVGFVVIGLLLSVLLAPLIIQPAPTGWRFVWEQAAAQGGFGPPGAAAVAPPISPWPRLISWLLFIAPTVAAALLTFSGWAVFSRTRGASHSYPAAPAGPSLQGILQKVALLLLMSVGFLASIQMLPKAEYLPSGNRNFIFVILKPYTGTNLVKLEELTDRIGAHIQALPEVKRYFAVAGNRFRGIGIIAKKEYESQLRQLVRKIQRLVSGAPGFEFALALQSNIFSRGLGKGFDIEVRGKDLEEVAALSERIKKLIQPQLGPRRGAGPGRAPGAKPPPAKPPQKPGGPGNAARKPFKRAALDGAAAADGRFASARNGAAAAPREAAAARVKQAAPPTDDPKRLKRTPGKQSGMPQATRNGNGIKGISFVRTSFETGNPEVQVVVDRERAADLGLTVREVADVVETLVAGRVATIYKEKGEKIDVRVKGTRGVYTDLGALNDLIIQAPNGLQVKLPSIARIVPTTGPTKIDHIELDRAVKLTVNVRPTAPLGEVLDDLTEQVLEPMRRALPAGYQISLAGSADKLQMAIREVSWSLVFAVVIVFLVMASLFESFLYPIIIIYSVPLAASGAILAVRITGAEYTMITRLGFIILAGIVVNNAILLVHQTLNNMREAGMEPYAALLESTRTRIRPIFMSTITSVLGMLPLAAGNEFSLAMKALAETFGIESAMDAVGLLPHSLGSAGSELYSGLGAAVVGGLMVSSLLTLVLVPAFFALFLDLRGVAARLLRRRGDEPAEPATA